MFAHTRVGRRVVTVDLKEDLKENERIVGECIAPAEREGRRLFCALVERSFYSSGWNIFRIRNGRGSDVSWKYVLEFTSEDDVVIRNSSQMKKNCTEERRRHGFC